MLHLQSPGSRLCDGLTRRDFLHVGGLALAGLTLPDLARAARGKSKIRSCIELFMWGGPSQLETFDLKPDAPEGIRGPFQPIATKTVGTRICEHLPLLARRTDRYAIIRSATHTGVNHGTSAYHMLTGHIHFTPGTLRHPTPNDHPSIGSSVTKYGPQPANVPSHVSIPSILHDGDGGEVPGQGAGMLGARYTPFFVNGDPTQADFSVDTLKLPGDINRQRFQQRLGLQAALEQHAEKLTRLPGPQAMDDHYERALRWLSTPATERAFHLAAEPKNVRDRYGMHHFGQSCLLARRLVEAGVPLITVYWNTPSLTDDGSWDTHKDNERRSKNDLLPHFDKGLAALLDDLHERGLLDETLIVWKGEFGRTPRINKNGGRDHWGFCQSVILAGGGIKGGQVHGSSDASAAYAAELPVSPDDLAATTFDRFGIPIDTEIRDAQGRPLPLCLGKPLTALM
ncbi:MAG: DUF1501 domain-containing protein [Gemmataceae bacterium]